jgi:type II secretory pathway pseudopilin PulG
MLAQGLAGGFGGRRGRRRSYTLVELLITVSIIGIMASMVLFALFSAQEQARAQKTRALVAKLNNVIRARYESYRTRRLPFPRVIDTYSDINQNKMFDSGTDKLTYDANNDGNYDAYSTPAEQLQIARMRLDMLRDYMRMEMPDRWSDVYDPPLGLPGVYNKTIPRPAASNAYAARYAAVTGQNVSNLMQDPNPKIDTLASAECLYMIVMEAIAQDGDARDVFRPDDVADTDGDGFPEFIDAWGTPIRFLRWAPGFISELQTLARAVSTDVTSSGQTVTVTFNGPAFSRNASDYVGGALAVLDVNQGERIDTRKMARITGYANDGANAVFTCETPTVAPQPPFGPTPPDTGDSFVVMAADPFDPRGLYPDYSSTSVPSYALYPLIYSCGPDRAPGIAAELDSSTPLRYASINANPFFVPSTAPPGWVGGFPLMMGSLLEPTSTSANFYVGCWNDNIHNHLLNMR